MPHAVFQVGDLTATIGDNAEHGGHRAGYNGLWSLRHADMPEAGNLFVPTVAGLNLEHIFDGQQNGAAEVFYEPRHAPMTFEQLSDAEAELHQPPTPTFHLESWTRFRLVAPHWIDVHFRCMPHQHAFMRGYLGLFWASYINAPEDKSMYFRGGLAGQGESWQQLCTQAHYDESTVLAREDDFELTFGAGFRDALYRNFSPIRYDLPFYYGLWRPHAGDPAEARPRDADFQWTVGFDRTEGIRLTHSPSGGGYNAALETTNPAWDFQFIVPDPEPGRTYEFRARASLAPRRPRQTLLNEYVAWRESL